MLISYTELCQMVEAGVIQGVDLKDVNGTSIDVYLGPIIKAERRPSTPSEGIISLRDKESIQTREFDITGSHFDLGPKAFALAGTRELFNLPDNISAEFKLNSSGARIGLENAMATWCDPYWNGSVLTLELTNLTQWHTIRLHEGVRIGQMIFHKSAAVPKDRGYGVRGRYNGDKQVQEVKAEHPVIDGFVPVAKDEAAAKGKTKK